jgi:pimeloyl-ACP methyl ester carboxylesterase
MQHEDAYDIPTLASDVAGVVKALGHDRCAVLVAHDW